MYSTHEKGILGELLFKTHLIELGYTVLEPVNPNSSYDIVVEKSGIFTRIQVKYCTPKNGKIRVELRRLNRKTANYKLRDVDAMGVYDSFNKKFYLIPLQSINHKDEFWLRVELPKNGQTKNINYADNYLI